MVGKFSRPKAYARFTAAGRGRESALSYATQRAGYGRAEIQVLDEAWNVVEMIGNEEARPLV